MPGLKVTPEQLNALSGTAVRTSAQVRDSHQSLRSQLSPLNSDWTGQAAGQFHALYEPFDKNARGLSDALDGIAALLARAGDNYSQAESAIASSFR